MKYDTEYCNIHDCGRPLYRGGMCREHYGFYMQEARVKKVHEQFETLREGNADWRLKLNDIVQHLVHYSIDFPMPFVEHFPLEHIFVSELFLMRKKPKDSIDVNRYRSIIKDFNRSDNENLALMKRYLDTVKVSDAKLGELNEYLLGKRELPSKIPFWLALLGFTMVSAIMKIHDFSNDTLLFGYKYDAISYWLPIVSPIVFVLIFILLIGLTIPSTYNALVRRAYDLSLFESVDENMKLLNQVLYTKERKDNGSYYATIAGTLFSTCATTLFLFFRNSDISTSSVFIVIGILMFIIGIMSMFCMMAFYSPVIDCVKRSNVKILLYNPDNQGGLSCYHSFLFRTLIYNLGVSTAFWVLITVVHNAFVSAFLIVCALPRFNHLGWSIILYVKSIKLFNRAKKKETETLCMQNSMTAMDKKEHLNNVHWTGQKKAFKSLIVLVLLPLAITYSQQIFEEAKDLFISLFLLCKAL